MRRLISSGSTFESQIGYSRAVVSGDWVFVSGTTGYDYSTRTISDDVEQQTRQALKNIGTPIEMFVLEADAIAAVQVDERSATKAPMRKRWRPPSSKAGAAMMLTG